MQSSSSTFGCHTASHAPTRVHRLQRWLPKLLVGAVLLAPLAAMAQGTTAKPPAGASSTSATTAAPKGSATTTAAASTAAPSANPTAVVAPAGSTATPTGTPGAMDGATYAVRLRDLEQRINELKEQIRRSHTRLALLSESILSGITAAARAEVIFENDMSSAFRLKRIVALYDGAPLATKTDERDTIGDQKEIPLYAELVQPGDHTLQVLLEYQGNGYGIFSYLKGYKFEVRSSRSFTAIEGKTLQLRVVGYEQGGPTTPLEERPAVMYVEKIQAGVGAAGAKKPETK
ncbi:MAG: hypothetical protein ABI175_29080 [Polyangiales bacterium]